MHYFQWESYPVTLAAHFKGLIHVLRLTLRFQQCLFPLCLFTRAWIHKTYHTQRWNSNLQVCGAVGRGWCQFMWTRFAKRRKGFYLHRCLESSNYKKSISYLIKVSNYKSEIFFFWTVCCISLYINKDCVTSAQNTFKELEQYIFSVCNVFILWLNK